MTVNVWDYMKPYSRLAKNEVFVGLKSDKERISYILESVRPLAEFRRELYQRAEKYAESHRKSIEKTKALIKEALVYHSNGKFGSAHYLFTKVSQSLI